MLLKNTIINIYTLSKRKGEQSQTNTLTKGKNVVDVSPQR
jgi:hypothetical protein